MNKFFTLIFTLLLFCGLSFAQTDSFTIRGRIVDPNGSAITKAKIEVINSKGETKTSYSNDAGEYRVGLSTLEEYRLVVSFDGFSKYEKDGLRFIDATEITLDILLEIAETIENVDVHDDNTELNVDPNKNKSGIVLRGEEIDNLPDDPEELDAYLKLLAGVNVGPDGGEISVDGFVVSKPPPKSTIQEIRINTNPYSAEFSSIGYGRIQIFTKIGADAFHSSFGIRYNDPHFNARDPFYSSRLPRRKIAIDVDVSGSYWKKRASYYLSGTLDFRKDTALVNATTLDQDFTVVSEAQAIPSPSRRYYFYGSNDYQLGKGNTLRLNYSRGYSTSDNNGVGELSLESQAYRNASNNQSFRVSQTSLFEKPIVNEIRFQFASNKNNIIPTNFSPTVVVSDSFNGGGQSIAGKSSSKNFSFSDILTYALTNYNVRAGAEFIRSDLQDSRSENIAGTFLYTGGLAPELENDQILSDINGNPILQTITSIERYRRTAYFTALGYVPSEVREFGGGASQYSQTQGVPDFKFGQNNFSAFFQTEHNVRENLSLGFGVRAELQSTVKNSINIAPRASMAWSFNSGKKKGLTSVFRVGAGVFYDRVQQTYFANQAKYETDSIRSILIDDGELIDQFTVDGNLGGFSGNSANSFEKRVAEKIRSPYSIQTSFSFEQALPLKGSTLSLTISDIKGNRLLRSRNVNAPQMGIRPYSDTGDIYQLESTAWSRSLRTNVEFATPIGKRNQISVRYNNQYLRTDTGGANSFPVNQYDVSGEEVGQYFNRLSLNGYFYLPLKINGSFLLLYSQGSRFNITTGEDENGDSIYNDRPCFATDLTGASIVSTEYGTFDLQCASNENTIPRNYGNGPNYLTSNLRLSRSFSLFKKSNPQGKQISGGMRLSISVTVWNVFNNTQLSRPIGNLSSPSFGKSISIAGVKGDLLSQKRSVHISARFSF